MINPNNCPITSSSRITAALGEAESQIRSSQQILLEEVHPVCKVSYSWWHTHQHSILRKELESERDANRILFMEIVETEERFEEESESSVKTFMAILRLIWSLSNRWPIYWQFYLHVKYIPVMTLWNTSREVDSRWNFWCSLPTSWISSWRRIRGGITSSGHKSVPNPSNFFQRRVSLWVRYGEFRSGKPRQHLQLSGRLDGNKLPEVEYFEECCLVLCQPLLYGSEELDCFVDTLVSYLDDCQDQSNLQFGFMLLDNLIRTPNFKFRVLSSTIVLLSILTPVVNVGAGESPVQRDRKLFVWYSGEVELRRECEARTSEGCRAASIQSDVPQLQAPRGGARAVRR